MLFKAPGRGALGAARGVLAALQWTVPGVLGLLGGSACAHCASAGLQVAAWAAALERSRDAESATPARLGPAEDLARRPVWVVQSGRVQCPAWNLSNKPGLTDVGVTGSTWRGRSLPA